MKICTMGRLLNLKLKDTDFVRHAMDWEGLTLVQFKHAVHAKEEVSELLCNNLVQACTLKDKVPAMNVGAKAK